MELLQSVFLQITVAVAIAGISSFITVRLSLSKFRTEKWWEKRVEAYERVLEAFHKAKKYSSEHLDAEYLDSQVSKERDQELIKFSKQAKEEITRVADIGSFLLSTDAMSLINEYQKEKNDSYFLEFHTFQEHAEHDYELVIKYLTKFSALAKVDLKSDQT
ncbi:hypothetical protein AB4323_23850 [Vibrio sp. 10N.261.52.C11]|uniref:DUF4760 domain-containing protein n=1 Tax=Vibrio atlanticus TaxID=693153 RepID=A0ABV4KUC8_9VIBR|nr:MULTISPECIES: hypothetical protein [Vibrio]